MRIYVGGGAGWVDLPETTDPPPSGVTAVTGAAPIASSGGTTPDISIAPATPATPGSMSAADKAKLDTLLSAENGGIAIAGGPFKTLNLHGLTGSDEGVGVLGITGASGETVGKVAFTFASAMVVLQTLAAGNLLDRAAVLIQTPFDDPSATIRLGTATVPDLVFAPGEIDVTRPGSYDDSQLFSFSSSDLFVLNVSPGASTQGSGILLYKLRS